MIFVGGWESVVAVVDLVTETVGGKRSQWTRLCGACTMLVLLGVPWIFSAFAVINASGDEKLELLQGIFNVSIDLHFHIGAARLQPPRAQV